MSKLSNVFDITDYTYVFDINMKNPEENDVTWIYHRITNPKQKKKPAFPLNKIILLILMKFPRWYAAELTGFSTKTITLWTKKYNLGSWGLVNYNKRPHRSTEKRLEREEKDLINLRIRQDAVNDMTQSLHYRSTPQILNDGINSFVACSSVGEKDNVCMEYLHVVEKWHNEIFVGDTDDDVIRILKEIKYE